MDNNTLYDIMKDFVESIDFKELDDEYELYENFYKKFLSDKQYSFNDLYDTLEELNIDYNNILNSSKYIKKGIIVTLTSFVYGAELGNTTKTYAKEIQIWSNKDYLIYQGESTNCKESYEIYKAYHVKISSQRDILKVTVKKNGGK